MSQLSEGIVLDALRQIKDPDLHKDIVTLGFIKDLKIDDGDVSFRIVLTTPACPVREEMIYYRTSLIYYKKRNKNFWRKNLQTHEPIE